MGQLLVGNPASRLAAFTFSNRDGMGIEWGIPKGGNQ
jgi:hypothetical protein